jgi:hypothetical protein
MKTRHFILLFCGNILYLIGSVFAVAHKPGAPIVKTVGLILLILMMADLAVVYFRKRKSKTATE